MTDLPVIPGGARRLSLVQPKLCHPIPCPAIIGRADLIREFQGLVNIRKAVEGAGIKLRVPKHRGDPRLKRKTTTEEDQ